MYKLAVIEDNRATADMIATTIRWEAIGCTVCGIAYNGVKGLAMVQQQRPDIIISDVRMPGMDGLTMAESLCRELPYARIIFISAYDEFAYAQKAVRLHAHEYLLKPLENEKLIDSVRRAVEELRKQDMGTQMQAEPTSAKDSLVSSILQYVNARPHHPTLQETAAHFGFSPSYISSIVKKETGKNYIELVTRSRMELAKKLLRDPSYRIEEVATAVGYKNYISFYQMFVKYEGVSPRDYRNGGEKN
ncbi:MAG: response regulator [Clostridia bacterium]|nr:response regulator [Clostridia bacterium]